MAEEIIIAEHVSKLYRLGDIHTGTLSHDLNRWWSRLTRREDPYEQLAEMNERAVKKSGGYVWSLNDVSFSVRKGEVFGIVGKNGAGKSTLLKLLSKITKPTRGTIQLNGRVATLLEVGTGFHPDLNGRENIFLNGAILGMRKQEIKNRFDEIVEFSGIGRYIDTPVKRYSSGMFVRLAFAVAAHLEPDILILDEVLAVGDAEFQQKCLGKMQSVSQQEGRTVLFVSHNIAAVKRLCNRAMLLDRGQVSAIDTVQKVVELYQFNEQDKEQGMRKNLPVNSDGYFTDWQLEGQQSEDPHSCFSRESVAICFHFQCHKELEKCQFHIMIRFDDDEILQHACSMHFEGNYFTLLPGTWRLSMTLSLPVRQGRYSVEAGLQSEEKWVDTWRSGTRLTILDTYDGYDNQASAGILNVKTRFNLCSPSSFAASIRFR